MSPIADLRIADIMSSDIAAVGPEDSLEAAAQTMAGQRISCLLVLDGRLPVGILTERDMVRLLHEGSPLGVPVKEVMTAPVLAVRASTGFRAAYALLRQQRVRHLAVTDEEGRVAGVVSETDFRNHVGRDAFRKIHSLETNMDRDILTLAPDVPLEAALQRMVSEKRDYAIVVDGSKPLGIVTERDGPALMSRQVDVSQVSLGQVMSAPVRTVKLDNPVMETIESMSRQRIRHMVVVHENGDIAGVISQHRLLEMLGVEMLEDAWQHSEEQYRAVVNTVREVIYQTNTHGQWIFLNPAWQELTGFPVEQSLGQRLTSFIHPEDRPRQAELFNALMGEEAGEFNAEMRYRHADGSFRWVEVFGRATRTREGRLNGVAGTLFDITERKAAASRLMEAAAAAEAANLAKSQFLGNMSHELRTPLNGVLGMTELLLMTSLDEEQQDYALTVRQSARALLDIIEQILEFSRLENGQVVLKDGEFSPGHLVRSISELFAHEAQAKGIILKVNGAADLPPCLLADVGSLRQILLNLIGNAVKFTAAGMVTVSVRAYAGPAAGEQTLDIGVRDTGIGMSAAAVRQLFAPFAKGDAAHESAYGGTGLGLSICRRLVDLMGGEITVESSEGVGSNFLVSIPCRSLSAA